MKEKEKPNVSKDTIRKKRTRSHVISDLSVNYLERIVLLNAFSCERYSSDYGYDVNIYTYDENGEYEGGIIYVQLKATDRINIVNKHSEVVIKLNRKHIHAWYYESYPVILVLYDAKADNAYWIYIQRYFEQLRNFDIGTVTDSYSIKIPVTNVLNHESIREFRSFKLSIFEQIKRIISHV